MLVCRKSKSLATFAKLLQKKSNEMVHISLTIIYISGARNSTFLSLNKPQFRQYTIHDQSLCDVFGPKNIEMKQACDIGWPFMQALCFSCILARHEDSKWTPSSPSATPIQVSHQAILNTNAWLNLKQPTSPISNF